MTDDMDLVAQLSLHYRIRSPQSTYVVTWLRYCEPERSEHVQLRTGWGNDEIHVVQTRTQRIIPTSSRGQAAWLDQSSPTSLLDGILALP